MILLRFVREESVPWLEDGYLLSVPSHRLPLMPVSGLTFLIL